MKQSGRSATWDVTVAHTLATSYVQNALQAGSAAVAVSARKTTKYSTLFATHTFFRWWWRLLVPCQTRLTASLQKSVEEPRFAQPIRGRETTFLYQCISVAIRISTQRALPTRSQFPSPHRNYSEHTFLLLLILRPWE